MNISGKFCLSAFLLALLALVSLGQQRKSLTNKDVADMVRQGLDENVIVKVIQASDTDFDTSQAALAELQSSGAGQHVLDAMVRAQSGKNGTPVADTSGGASAAAGTAPAAASQPAASALVPRTALAGDANPGKYLLTEGTEVPLKFASDLSSKTASDGDRIELLLDGDLKVDGVVVAKDGSHAVAVVANAKKAGMMGKPGELNIQLEHMVTGDNRIRLRGTKGREGESKTGTAVALTVLFGPIGLIKHGKNVEVKAGTPLTAFVDQEIWLPPAN